jgi:hypothetical protein
MSGRCKVLRAIETQREEHEGGWHGRYMLRSIVTLADKGQQERRAA